MGVGIFWIHRARAVLRAVVDDALSFVGRAYFQQEDEAVERVRGWW
jgi:hypothetical protein